MLVFRLQLTFTTKLPKLYNQLTKLATLLHLIKETVQTCNITQVRAEDTGNDRVNLVLLDKFDHVLEFLAGAHCGAPDVDVLENSLHEERHLGGDGHAVHGDDTAGLDIVKDMYIPIYVCR